MRLSEMLGINVNPMGDPLVCHDVEPLAASIGIYFLCDRSPKHKGKHRYRGEKGLVQWWKNMKPADA